MDYRKLVGFWYIACLFIFMTGAVWGIYMGYFSRKFLDNFTLLIESAIQKLRNLLHRNNK
ncbi:MULTISPECIES: hypothetical protein [Hungatella]|uniref:hypothetical protein n=1 Tax=Hungatella TaxID=1649459 RepID=UPI0006E1A1F4|nr:hypothetical protein [Hungatella hathewayi]